MKTLKKWVAAAAIVGLAGAAQAGLVNRGNGMIYDSTRNITWLADMNYAKTSGYDGDGRMTWSQAKAWADNLTFGGYSDWRLPTLNPADTTCSNNFNAGGSFGQQYYGYNCSGGELSGLFVTDLGNKAGQSVLNQTGDTPEQIANLALFSNVQSYRYWSGLEFAPVSSYAWFFNTNIGFQDYVGKDFELYAVAVRPGDVAAAVPEPQTLALVMMAFGAAMVACAGCGRPGAERCRASRWRNWTGAWLGWWPRAGR